jgi:predicted metal-dependent enzyme (double-stranded beta helix superfamily)
MSPENPTQPAQSTADLVRLLDQAVAACDDDSRCTGVMEALMEAVSDGASFLPEEFLAPVEPGYARRLLHKSPNGCYSVVVMVWGPGQSTPLHDHSGMWCVECVYQGQILVRNYERVANRDSAQGIMDFEAREEVVAGIGEAGKLIPPFEYHTIGNVESEPAVTIHVYGGEITSCQIFTPAEEGGFRLEVKTLGYSE